jgi:gamma-glutamyltranspeptidase/glutathione hydrolase
MSSSFPNSFYPHSYRPGVLQLEREIDPGVGEELSRLGHNVEWLQPYDAGAGAVCAIEVDQQGETLSAGADMRRESYAIGR